MKYILEANFKTAEGNIYNGYVTNVEYGGWIGGIIKDENGNILGSHLSSTLDWLEQDLLDKVPFDKEKDTYTKNW